MTYRFRVHQEADADYCCEGYLDGPDGTIFSFEMTDDYDQAAADEILSRLTALLNAEAGARECSVPILPFFGERALGAGE